MKIMDIKATAVFPSSLFVRVFTDEGITGIGECSPMNVAVIKEFIDHALKPSLLGENPVEIDRLWNKVFFKTYKLGVQGIQPEAIAGVDIALWDILGKATRLPVHALLGGAYRDTIQLYASIGGGGHMAVRDMVKAVEVKLAEGFKAFKIRMDWGISHLDANPTKDLDMFKAVKSILNKEYPLSFDANNGYSVPTAISQGRKFEDAGICHYEEPVPQYDYPGLKQVADALDVPVAAGEHEYTRWQIHDLITRGGIDIVQADVVKCGGISEFRKIATIVELYNKIMLPHQTQPTVGHVASMHACASIQNCTRPHEFTGRRPDLEALFTNYPAPVDGIMAVPKGPGLGLEMDEDAFKEIDEG
ncbi:MAG: mandelate racemase/muconate lactonizing enzyme family protein [Candidatus Lokiarchaeota archaeon]|nr:mandelate racemase/muconate lactonizing enzyme family protein [Candidatus Lokiarchaeota archaeon]